MLNFDENGHWAITKFIVHDHRHVALTSCDNFSYLPANLTSFISAIPKLRVALFELWKIVETRK